MTPESPPNALFSTREAANLLGLSHQQLTRKFLDGKLAEVGHVGGKRVLTPADVAEIKRVLDAK